MDTKIYRNPIVIGAGLLALGLISATFIGGSVFYKIRSINTLSVVGSAKTRVTADLAKWTFTISEVADEYSLQSGYARLAKSLSQVDKFLSSNGIASKDIVISPVLQNEKYEYDPSAQGGPREFDLRQDVTVSSSDVEKINNLAKNTEVLVRAGVFVLTQYPQFYYSKLANLRVSLLGDAVRDAKARAVQLAESSDRKIGTLQSASSGVVQVLSPDSVEVSDYGQYDTVSIEKDVMVTVRAAFFVR